jgi:hypothetical protein
LTAHDIASEATWADKYRDGDRSTTKIRYEATWRWHFVNIELKVAICLFTFGLGLDMPAVPHAGLRRVNSFREIGLLDRPGPA